MEKINPVSRAARLPGLAEKDHSRHHLIIRVAMQMRKNAMKIVPALLTRNLPTPERNPFKRERKKSSMANTSFLLRREPASS
ncbi:MAG: hypothetical protein PHU56_02630 [Candidatus Pacebacteria bacterium]|nr:hypothetical protein [Candidatus Paceibacterota bacterium]